MESLGQLSLHPEPCGPGLINWGERNLSWDFLPPQVPYFCTQGPYSIASPTVSHGLQGLFSTCHWKRKPLVAAWPSSWPVTAHCPYTESSQHFSHGRQKGNDRAYSSPTGKAEAQWACVQVGSLFWVAQKPDPASLLSSLWSSQVTPLLPSHQR